MHFHINVKILLLFMKSTLQGGAVGREKEK